MKNLFAWAMLICSIPATHAGEAAASEFPGRYVRQFPDAWNELVVLEDNSFCINIQTGSDNVLMAGNWQQNGDRLALQEVRKPSRAFVSSARADVKNPNGRRVDFLGLSLLAERGKAFIFGTSTDGQVPADMRPILAADHNGFDEHYALPLGNNPDESIFFGRRIGPVDPATELADYEITEFRFNTPEKNLLRVSFNKEVNRPLFKAELFFRDGHLIIDRRTPLDLGTRQPLTEEGVAGVKSHCTDPILKPGLVKSKTQWVEPLRVFEMKLKNPEARPPYFEKAPGAPAGRAVING